MKHLVSAFLVICSSLSVLKAPFRYQIALARLDKVGERAGFSEPRTSVAFSSGAK